MVEVNRLYEVQTYLSLTNHIWSGFDLLDLPRFRRHLGYAADAS